jgi:hypothetical protein
MKILFLKANTDPAGFLEPSPVHWFIRFSPVQPGSKRFFPGFVDYRFLASVWTGAVTGSRSNRSNRPVRSGSYNIGFKELMTSKLDQVLDILMTPHLVSHDKKYILMYYIQFYIVTHSQKNYVLKYASVDSRQIFEVLMTMKHDQTEQILVTLLFSKSQLFI